MNHHRGATSFMVWPTCTEDSVCVADFIRRRICVSWFSDVNVNWKDIESTLPMGMHYRKTFKRIQLCLNKHSQFLINAYYCCCSLRVTRVKPAAPTGENKTEDEHHHYPLYLAGSTWSPALFDHYPTRLIGVRCSGGSCVVPLYGTVSTLTFEQFKTSV